MAGSSDRELEWSWNGWKDGHFEFLEIPALMLISFPSELMTTMMDWGSCLSPISTLIPNFCLFPVMLAGSK
jgi:hypothetical protein